MVASSLFGGDGLSAPLPFCWRWGGFLLVCSILFVGYGGVGVVLLGGCGLLLVCGGGSL